MNEYDLWDKAAAKPRMCREMCESCIFRPASPVTMSLAPGRLKGLIQSALKAESYIVCHSTFDAEPAVCRGFADRYSTNGLRILDRLMGFHEIDAPTKVVSA
jgi:hypothetical protein